MTLPSLPTLSTAAQAEALVRALRQTPRAVTPEAFLAAMAGAFRRLTTDAALRAELTMIARAFFEGRGSALSAATLAELEGLPGLFDPAAWRERLATDVPHRL